MALIKCRECGHKVSSTAKSCPNCGASIKKGGYGFIILLLIIIFFVSIFWGSGNDSSKSNKIDTQSDSSLVKRGIAQDVGLQQETVITKQELEKYKQMQADRLKFIESLTNKGIIQKIETSGSQPYLRVNLWVTPAFKALDFDTKSTFAEVVWCYYFDEPGRKNTMSETVYMKDNLTGKELGSFSPFNVLSPGLNLK